MDAVQKEMQSRKDEIIKELELLFKANMKITDWDVPESDDNEAAKILVEILQEGLDKIKADIEAGKYTNY
ncbi:hypothetical protein MNB_SM-7-1522 [hydrothermal vent metagenome]|uniref:Uncharacterized protein n=1 Tax=hydrothermal vent metagenome TaxID=652676 RepID=A0A1W1B9I7_9ZZZZ